MEPSNASQNDAAEEEELRQRARTAFAEGRFTDSFSLLHASLLSSALRWFREEGVIFSRPPGEVTPTELFVGLAVAAKAELDERGDEAPYKLWAAHWLFESVADLRIALTTPAEPSDNDLTARVGEITMRAIMLGQIDATMMAIQHGWLDKAGAYEFAQAQRRAAAEKTNAKKATLKERALGEAIRISGKNPTLSHEDLALKIRDSLNTPTTIKTLTDWIRSWRKAGMLQVQKRP